MAQHICSICLQEQTNSTFLSPCFHFYCFACIRQWVAIASYCPLCKCAIDTLIHSVDEDKGTFEEYSLAGLSYCSVDEEQDSLQSTVHRGRQVPDPPQRTLQQQIAAQRFDLYHGQVKVTAHPPALACYAALECLAPVHKPRNSWPMYAQD
ncbi:hypothetical protein BDF14DRAFT_1745984 [Spinellus fusiger]|nr:hypothetical protein BDF14DRAFT_1745984 [Spinellus fusiger]